MSANFPDFVAKTRAAICGELQASLLAVRQHTEVIRSIADGWCKVSGMDLFSSEGEKIMLTDLEKKHRLVQSLGNYCLFCYFESHPTCVFVCPCHQPTSSSYTYARPLLRIHITSIIP